MKIGILTWFFAANYGAKAHTFALQEYLKEKGYEVEFVNYRPTRSFQLNLLMNIEKPLRINQIIFGIMRCVKLKMFNSNYKCSKKVSSSSEINQLGYDIIILGSDEVFNSIHPLHDKIYFGADINIPCISYAPSAGQASADICLSQEIKKSIKKIKNISVRDEHTRTLIKNNVEKKIDVVCDPTFLYDFKKISKPLNVDKYVLIYSFNDLSEYKESIKQYSKSHNLKIVMIGKYSKWVDKSYPSLSLNKWTGAFQNAKLVITDSFHGSVFAIKNQVECVVIDRSDKTNKISNLFNYLGIKKSFYHGNESIDDYIMQNTIDYDLINNNITKRLQESKEFLRTSLENAGGLNLVE